MQNERLRQRIPSSQEKNSSSVSIPEDMSLISIISKAISLFFSTSMALLIAVVSIITILSLISILVTGTLFGSIVSQDIPIWFAAVAILIFYTLIILPLKALRYAFSPKKPYSLYRPQSTSRYGDATLWFAFLILLVLLVSQYSKELSQDFEIFSGWWKNFAEIIPHL